MTGRALGDLGMQNFGMTLYLVVMLFIAVAILMQVTRRPPDR